MAITKVKWKDHPILGNLELNFINTNTGLPYKTIVFAGENGTGKTTILKTISSFLSGESFEYFDYIEYRIDNNIFKAIESDNPNRNPHKGMYRVIGSNLNEEILACKTYNPKNIGERDFDIRKFGCVFSKARADYNTSKITSTTTKELDTEKFDTDQEDNFTSAKQLIVDVENQDSDDYKIKNILRGDEPEAWGVFYPSSKIYRFKNAFNTFFEKIKYDGVKNDHGEKSIKFTKNLKLIDIDSLSTGEKQIVFRGIYLLRNSKNLDGASIMIDEPELSMHPKWEKKILKYYKDLFTDNTGFQKSQLFIATHSEHVLSEALSDKNDTIVFTLSESGGIINSKKIDSPSVLPSITNAEINYLAFDIVTNDYHIELYGYLQYKESLSRVKNCDTYIHNCPHYNQSTHSKPSSYNSTTYNTLSTYIRNAIDHPDPSRTFTQDELRVSIDLLRDILK